LIRAVVAKPKFSVVFCCDSRIFDVMTNEPNGDKKRIDTACAATAGNSGPMKREND
jgi:hypothetical protein